LTILILFYFKFKKLKYKANTTGTHSVFTKYAQYNIMFHVSTLMPFTSFEKQQVLFFFFFFFF